jgi:hypothetical protein
MSLSAEETFFGLTPGCPTHGEEYVRECSMCGIEFCTRCFRHSVVCSECALEASNDDDPDDEPDFKDVTHLDALLEEDAEVEEILKASEDMPPPEGLADDTRAGDTRPGDTRTTQAHA